MTNTEMKSLIRIYTDETRTPEERNAASRALSAGLVQPRLLLGMVPEHHPLRQEALLAADAFEAVTNGMCDPELLAGLDTIVPDSPLYPWTLLIRGVHALYGGQQTAALEFWRRVDRDSAPALLTEPLAAVLERGSLDAIGEGAARREFVRGLFRDDRVVQDAFVQLETCAESGLSDLLADTLILLLKELVPREPALAEEVFVWSMNRWPESLLSSEALPVRIRSLFGKCAGLDLLAAATREVSPDRSLFYHLDAFESRIRENSPEPEHLRIFLDETDRLWETVQREFEVDEAYRGYFQDRRDTILRQMEHLLPREESAVCSRPTEETPEKPGRFVQLDLFGA